MRRNDICLYLSPDDRVELQSLVADRNSPRKLVWRAEIVLATADGLETLDPRLSNIVRHAERLTVAPAAMTESDLEELRAVELDDKDRVDLKRYLWMG